MCDISSMGGGAPQKIGQIAQTTTQVAGANGGAPAQVPMKDATQVAGAAGGGAIAGGGPVTGVGMNEIQPVLTQLTQVISGLATVLKNSNVAGATGGGSTPAPAAAAQPAAPVTTTPPAATTPVAGGGGTADASAGAAALLPVLTQLIEVIKALAAALTAQGSATGGGAPGKIVQQTPSQVAGENGGGAPEKGDVDQTPPTKVAGANGGGAAPAKGECDDHVGQMPSQVDGANGGGAPEKGGVAQTPPTKVGGAKGDGVVQQHAPGKAGKHKKHHGKKKGHVGGASGPGQTPPAKDTTQVGGASGGPAQTPPAKGGTQVGGASGVGQSYPPMKYTLPVVKPLDGSTDLPSQVAGAFGLGAPMKFPHQVGGAWGPPYKGNPITITPPPVQVASSTTTQTASSSTEAVVASA